MEYSPSSSSVIVILIFNIVGMWSGAITLMRNDSFFSTMSSFRIMKVAQTSESFDVNGTSMISATKSLPDLAIKMLNEDTISSISYH